MSRQHLTGLPGPHSNFWQTVILLTTQLLLLALTGWLVAGRAGLLGLLLGGVLTFLFAPRLQTRVVMQFLGARSLNPVQVPWLAEAVQVLARRAGLPHEPGIGYLPTGSINAFSIGRRNDSFIIVTEGLLRTLNGREMTGVLAHEISHIAGNDLGIMALADLAMRLTGAMGRLGILLAIFSFPAALMGGPVPSLALVLVLVLAPLVSSLVQLGLSRTREHEADFNAARITGDPLGLASALVQIGRLQGDGWQRLMLPGRRERDLSVLRSHPVTEDRVRRLEALSEQIRALPEIGLSRAPHGWFGQPQGLPPSRSRRWRLGGWW